MICSDVLAESVELHILFGKRPDIMINDSDSSMHRRLEWCTCSVPEKQ